MSTAAVAHVTANVDELRIRAQIAQGELRISTGTKAVNNTGISVFSKISLFLAVASIVGMVVGASMPNENLGQTIVACSIMGGIGSIIVVQGINGIFCIHKAYKKEEEARLLGT